MKRNDASEYYLKHARELFVMTVYAYVMVIFAKGNVITCVESRISILTLARYFLNIKYDFTVPIT